MRKTKTSETLRSGKMSKLDKAVQDLKWALISYCEEADVGEAKRIDRAWETVLDVLYPEEEMEKA